MTYIANMWDSLITAFMKPFVRISENRLKLLHTIETDKLDAQQRHIETIVDSQVALVTKINEGTKETTGVLREWLEGFHKFTAVPTKAPPTNNDERMWRLEMEELARTQGVNVANDLSPYELEALVRQGFKDL